jgi:hypothetical protein
VALGQFNGTSQMKADSTACSFCNSWTTAEVLTETRWSSTELLHRLAEQHPDWEDEDDACPACLQQALLQLLMEEGDEALHESIQPLWPRDDEAAYGAQPSPLRMHADPRFTGKGITIALIDSAFYPHPDLVRPHNRIRAWVDASKDSGQVKQFEKDEMPYWPGRDAQLPEQWYGMMTANVR